MMEDAIDEAHGRAVRVLEAVIFASSTPVADAELASYLPAGIALDRVLSDLIELYRYRGIRPERVAGGWQFRTAPDLAEALHQLRVETRKLTRAQLETLAIIAYHQPVTRAEIEDIRGVALHKGTLDLLMEAGWIGPKGRRETPGRPITWATTAGFLDHFGLAALSDLPNLDALKAAGLLDARPVEPMGELGPADDREAASAEEF